MIKYIGSKRLLAPRIEAVVSLLPGVHRVLDLFSGTARVGMSLKRRGYHVTANDHTAFTHTLARCYIALDGCAFRERAKALLDELSRVPARPGYFTETFCERSRYVHPKNGARIDAIRDAIATLQLEPDLEAIALVSLMEAADRVDSTVGVQMAYLKRWAARAHNELELRMPELIDGAGEALRLDALEAAGSGVYDLAYLDPPYNQHKYLNNYHVWESLVRWDKPDVYGIACKRLDCREYSSPFNSKRSIGEALLAVVRTLRARYLLVSFNDEGHLSEAELREILETRGPVQVLALDHPRYVGAKIGIYNPQGIKTGQISHLRNRELLFLVDCEARGGVDLSRACRLDQPGLGSAPAAE